jgi:DNA-binding transcriptional ArsR family regulator
MPTESSDGSSSTGALDYDIDDTVEASTPEAMKAMADETRRTILDLLLDRAATTTHLAKSLDKPKGTVGYHLKVLEAAGLVRVVRTRPVRAMIEKYYGRVGRTIVIKSPVRETARFPILEDALAEARIHSPEDPLPMFTLRHIRIPASRAVEFAQRLVEVSDEFVSEPRGGDVVYGLIAGIYPTDHPILRSDDGE